MADLPATLHPPPRSPTGEWGDTGDTGSERSAARTYEHLSSRVSSASADDDEVDEVESPTRSDAALGGGMRGLLPMRSKAASKGPQQRAGFEGTRSFLSY